MLKSFDVAVRTQEGKIERYHLDNVESWYEAREFIMREVPGARTVLVAEAKPRERPQQAAPEVA